MNITSNNTINNTSINECINHLIKGDITEEQLEILSQWLENDAEYHKYIEIYKKNGFNMNQGIHQVLKKNTFDIVNLKPTQSTVSKRKSNYLLMGKVVLIIVSIVFVITFSYFYFFNALNNKNLYQVIETRQKNRNIQLYNQLYINLHNNTKLTYPEKLGTNDSLIIELEGSAVLNFKNSDSVDLFVKTPNGTVNSKGATFWVKSKKNRFKIHVYKGEVVVKNAQETIILGKDEVYQF